MPEDRVTIEITDHVALVTLKRVSKHNALDLPMFDALREATERLREEPDLNAVVLCGEGKSFCSGIDLGSVTASGGIASFIDALGQPPPNYFQRAAYDWITLPVPVIAAIHGHCLGGGLQIALAADIRIAAPDSQLSVMEVRLGLIPDMGITRTLPRLVGIDVAKELTYTGRIISGEEAHRLGLVTHVSEEPLRDAKALAGEIAAHSPDAIRGAKRLYDEAWSGSPTETLGLEARLQSEILGRLNAE